MTKIIVETTIILDAPAFEDGKAHAKNPFVCFEKFFRGK